MQVLPQNCTKDHGRTMCRVLKEIIKGVIHKTIQHVGKTRQQLQLIGSYEGAWIVK